MQFILLPDGPAHLFFETQARPKSTADDFLTIKYIAYETDLWTFSLDSITCFKPHL